MNRAYTLLESSFNTNPKRSRVRGEQGYVIILLALGITVLMGAVGFALDLGAGMLNQQRSVTVSDMSTIVAGTAAKHGGDEATVKALAGAVATANLSVQPGVSAADLLDYQSKISFTPISDSASGQDGVLIHLPIFGTSSFWGYSTGETATKGEVVSAAYFAEEAQQDSMHTVLLMDVSTHGLYAYGNGCSGGVTGIQCNEDNAAQEKPCSEGCASELSVNAAFAKELISKFDQDDVLSLIAFSATAEIQFSTLTMDDDGRKKALAAIDRLVARTESIGTYSPFSNGYLGFSDPAAGLFAAADLLKASEPSIGVQKRAVSVIVAGTGSPEFIPLPPIWNSLEDSVDGPHSVTLLDGSEMKLSAGGSLFNYPGYRQGLPIATLEDAYTINGCVPNFDDCRDYYVCEGIGKSCDQTESIARCAANPTLMLHAYAGAAALQLQSQHEAVIFSAGFGTNEAEQYPNPAFTAGVYSEAAYKQRFYAQLANDKQAAPITGVNTLDCVGKRSEDLAGKYVEVAPVGYSISENASYILENARYVGGVDGDAAQSRSVHLVDPTTL